MYDLFIGKESIGNDKTLVQNELRVANTDSFESFDLSKNFVGSLYEKWYIETSLRLLERREK